MRKILTFLLIAALVIPAGAAFAETVNVGQGLSGNVSVNNTCKINFPMGEGGGRSSNPALNPFVGAVARTTALENAAKKITESFNQSSTMMFNSAKEGGHNCLINIDALLMTGDLGEIISGIIGEAINILLEQACNWILDQIMGAASEVMSIYNQAAVDIPLIGGSIGLSDFVKVNVSPGSGGVTYTIQDKSDAVSNAASSKMQHVTTILSSTKASTFQDRLKSGKK